MDFRAAGRVGMNEANGMDIMVKPVITGMDKEDKDESK